MLKHVNLRVGQMHVIWDVTNFGSMIIYIYIYVVGKSGAKFSSISHSHGPILMKQMRESHAKWMRVGKPGFAVREWFAGIFCNTTLLFTPPSE